MKLDRIIISVNDNPDYYQILPLVYQAWKKFFPEAVFTLVIVIKEINKYNFRLITKMEKYCDEIKVLQELSCDYPSANVAKIARFYEAGNYHNEIVMINDIDLIPLQREYFLNKLQKKLKDHILCIGRDVYKGTKHKGKFPLGYITGESCLFKELFNTNIPWFEFVNQFVGYNSIDNKEDITLPFKKFSDESLIRALLRNTIMKTCHSNRDFEPGLQSVTRHAKLKIPNLIAGEYIEAHHLLPVDNYLGKINTIAKYLDLTFDKDWIL